MITFVFNSKSLENRKPQQIVKLLHMYTTQILQTLTFNHFPIF